MSWLLDTNVISELTRKRPNPHVREWLLDQAADEFYLSVLMVAELKRGILLRGPGRKTSELLEWWDRIVRDDFDGRILPVTFDVSVRWAELTCEAQQRGTSLPILDSLIAATASHFQMTVATHNVKDFEACGASVFSPWPE